MVFTNETIDEGYGEPEDSPWTQTDQVTSHYVGTLSDGFKGVTIDTIVEGDDNVSIHYVGTLSNGTKFDSTWDRGSPFETVIGVGKVIKGLDEGVKKLSFDQKAKLTCPTYFAYGARGFPPIIPPNATLVFEVELLRIY